jgi:hypothetical protein
MELDVSAKNEGEGDAGGDHPEQGVDRGGQAEGSRLAEALLEELDVEAERAGHEHAGNVESAHYAMELREAAAEAEAGGELHWAQEKGASTGNSVRQEPPLERLVVLPDRIVGMDQEALVVTEATIKPMKANRRNFGRTHELRAKGAVAVAIKPPERSFEEPTALDNENGVETAGSGGR